jgi:hypothetical protein
MRPGAAAAEGEKMKRLVKRSGGLLLAGVAMLALAPVPSSATPSEQTALTIRVIDAASGDPIFQARLTLEFLEPGGFMKRSKWISYSAKTDKKGEYKFVDIPKGPIRLFVTAPDHEAFGHRYKLQRHNQLIKVKLRKPQPVL